MAEKKKKLATISFGDVDSSTTGITRENYVVVKELKKKKNGYANQLYKKKKKKHPNNIQTYYRALLI